jgi:uroporphyrin-3 C-methyltransferase
MSEERTLGGNTDATPAAMVPAAHTVGSGGVLPVLALIVALGAAGFTTYQWYQDRGADTVLRSELARRLADMETQNKDATARVLQAAAALRETEVKVGVLEAKLAESQNQQIALEALYQELSRNRDEWAFADIEQSVLRASQQLQIAANVRTALIGLENVEARLQRMDQPRYSALRRALTRDIERLKALPLVDVYGTSARLDDAIAAIDRLPLAMDARALPDVVPAAAPATEPPAWERVVREAWRELRKLVRVQSSGVQDAALLAPEQAFFLRENLKLRLLGARIALLSRDGKSYRSDLQAAQAALERHFDARDSDVITTAAALRKLQAAQVQIDLPDLQETLEAVHKLRVPRAKGSA